MKNQIIKSYTNWLNENLLIAEAEGVDIAALYKAGNRAAIIEAAMTTDSAEVKAHPAYAATMEWWKRGSGDINLFQSIFKKGSARKSDQANSLKSAYYWAGSGSNAKMNTNLVTFYNVANSIITNGAKLGLDANKINGLKTAVAGLKDSQANGFLLKSTNLLGAFIPAAFTDGKFDTGGKSIDVAASLASNTPDASLLKQLKTWTVAANSDPGLSKDPATSYTTLKTYQTDPAKSNIFWQSSLNLTDAQKIELLNTIKARTDKYVAKHPDVDLTKAISIATDLYIAPKATAINIKQEAAPVAQTPAPITVSYPGAPKSDDDQNSKDGQSLFPDNGITVTPDATAKLNEVVKTAIDAVKAAGGTITAVKTWGWSGTSKVGTTYTSATGTGNPALATDRLTSINTALAKALTDNGVTVTPTVDATRNKAVPNQGTEWTDKDKVDPKWGTPGARTPEYNKEFGPYRFSIAFMELTYTIQPGKITSPAAIATASGTWKVFMSWEGESMTINPPTIKLGGWYPTLPKIGKPGVNKCPVF
jgi:hypothetical protein